jgi:hypothetical protein
MGTVKVLRTNSGMGTTKDRECMTFLLAIQSIHFRIKIDPAFQNISWRFHSHIKHYRIMLPVCITEINYRKYGGPGKG